MELPLDIQRKIALELEPYDLISFCAANKTTNQAICNADVFWRLKLQKDFPELFNYFQVNNMVLKSPKNTYMRTFIKLSELIEQHSEGLYIPRHNSNIHDIINIFDINVRNKIYKVLYDSYSLIRPILEKNPDYDFNTMVILDIINRNIKKHNLHEVRSYELYYNLEHIVSDSPLKTYYRHNFTRFPNL